MNSADAYGLSELGIATHYIPARRIPILLERLSALEAPTPRIIDTTIEELHYERQSDEPPPPLTGAKRVALDSAFQHDRVEQIVKDLEDLSKSEGIVSEWAARTLSSIHMRSPTSLKVALRSIRWGKKHGLQECLQRELEIATAFCVRPSCVAMLYAEIMFRTAQVATSRLGSLQCSSTRNQHLSDLNGLQLL
jgi:3-hydroxyisobutyryl-CoA hydrolase